MSPGCSIVRVSGRASTEPGVLRLWRASLPRPRHQASAGCHRQGHAHTTWLGFHGGTGTTEAGTLTTPWNAHTSRASQLLPHNTGAFLCLPRTRTPTVNRVWEAEKPP